MTIFEEVHHNRKNPERNKEEEHSHCNIILYFSRLVVLSDQKNIKHCRQDERYQIGGYCTCDVKNILNVLNHDGYGCDENEKDYCDEDEQWQRLVFGVRGLLCLLLGD